MIKNFFTRLLTITFILPIFLLNMIFVNSYLFIFFSIIIYVFITYEWFKLQINKYDAKNFFLLIIVYITMTLYSSCLHYFDKSVCCLIFFVWYVISIYIFLFPKFKSFWKDNVIYNVISVFFMPISFVVFIKMHNIHYNFVCFICVIPCILDASAYICGSIWGKNTFFFYITPKKTIEGIIGSLVFVIFLLFYVKYQKYNNIYLSWKIIFLIAFFSVIGDLFASVIKRLASKKDSSKLLPGHGGIIDRLDSAIPTICISYAAHVIDVNYKYFYI